MSGAHIVFSDGYKYQLREDYVVNIEIRPAAQIHTAYIDLSTDGDLMIRAGYAWDGPSGPAIDTPSFLRGSLVHDALYQLMRERHLDHDRHRDLADQILRRICLEDGMTQLRAWWVYQGVRKFGDACASPSAERPPKIAP